jgi:hypothetical protein
MTVSWTEATRSAMTPSFTECTQVVPDRTTGRALAPAFCVDYVYIRVGPLKRTRIFKPPGHARLDQRRPQLRTLALRRFTNGFILTCLLARGMRQSGAARANSLPFPGTALALEGTWMANRLRTHAFSFDLLAGDYQ